MKSAANVVHGLPDAVLAGIERAIRDPSLETRQTAVEGVVASLRDTGYLEWAAVAEGALVRPNLLQPIPVSADEARLMKFGNTPNVAAFTTLLGNYERIASAVGFSKAEIVHDETSSMQEVFQGFEARMSDPSFVDAVREVLPVAFPLLQTVDRARFASSRDEPLIQAADVLGATVAHLSKAAVVERDLDQSETTLVAPTLFGLLQPIPVAHAVISEALLPKITRLIKIAVESAT